ncbi:MAG TPA: asparagine synthase (glutamine-hydrolyzing) [Candidatus Kapabacteria bacterium]|jgi:asparagine synthase (glutamine-hydrolysing)
MCGIAGMISMGGSLQSERHRLVLSAMTDTMHRRGPDDAGIEFSPSGQAAFGHRRLSIIDPTPEAHQPMTSLSGNMLVFNGEIYNYKELRSTYRLNVPPSDTAVLLALLEKKGTSVLSELRGFFSFGYWKEKEQELILVRDSIGKKPLYYGTFGSTFLFASELRALFASGMVPFEISREALSAFLRFYSVPHPLSMIDGIQMLPPGSILRLSSNGIRMEQWYRLPRFDPISIPYQEAVSETRRILERSVHDRLVSDVPIGAFLSGGLDSNAIVGLASRVSSDRIKTVSLGFREQTATPDETEFARIGANAFGTDHHEWKISSHDIAALLPEFFSTMDSPSGDGLNSFLIAKAARTIDSDLKVILSGVGGDEAFLGYAKYRWLARRAQWLKMIWAFPKSLRSKGAEFLLGGRHTRMRSGIRSAIFPEGSRALFRQSEIQTLCGRKWNDSRQPLQGDAFLSTLRFDEEHYLPDMLLRDLDATTMWHHLEARAPLLDRELLEFTWQLPLAIKTRGTNKQLLLDAVRDIIPEAIMKKPKTGFELPMKEWLHSNLREYLDLLLSNSLRVTEMGILETSAIRTVHRDFIDGKSHYLKPWTIIALEQWICALEKIPTPQSVPNSIPA